ncbi:MAG: cytochrome c [Stellaceae bacterium]
MKITTALVLTALAVVAFGADAVLAQSDAVKTREHLMKENNGHAKIMVEMMRGQKPYDAKAVEAAFTQ